MAWARRTTGSAADFLLGAADRLSALGGARPAAGAATCGSVGTQTVFGEGPERRGS